jgi:hypothetical protein
MSCQEWGSPHQSKPNHIPSIGSIYEPPPEPQTPKETLLHPSEFPIEFKDFGNTSKYFWHNPQEEVSPREEPLKEWLMEMKRSSKAIQILSSPTTIPCSLRGMTNIEALHNPIVGTSIMSKFLAKNLLGNMLLVPTNKLFKSLLGLFFKCCGIARVVPIIINEIEVHLDFHIYAILEFNILIGYPLEKKFNKNLSLGAMM